MKTTIRRASIWVFSLNMLAIVLALIISYQGGRDPFGERGYITFFSTFQLLAIAWLADKILHAKKALKPAPKRSIRLFWRAISVGFIFLAADEFLSIHETADVFIHSLLKLQETPVTDRIDDAIIGLYAIFGIIVSLIHRSEIKGHQQAMTFFKWGFILLIGMIVLDFVSNDEVFLGLFFEFQTANLIQEYLYQLEDSLKILAEAFWIMAFYVILVVTKSKKRLESVQDAFQPEEIGWIER